MKLRLSTQPTGGRAGNNRLALRAAAWLGLMMACALPAADVTPPTLVSVQPPNGAQGVASNAVVRFTFSEAMSTGLSPDVRFALAGSGGWRNWAPSWSADKKVLSCTPAVGWPSGALLTWHVGTNFADLSGNRLTQDTLGTFQTAATGSSGSSPTVMDVTRTDRYTQEGSTGPARATTDGFGFTTAVQVPATRIVDSAELRLPGAQVTSLAPASLDGTLFAYEENSSDAGRFDSLYLDGWYRFRITEGLQTQDALALMPLAPATPFILAWDQAQAVPADQPFTLAWSPLAEGAADDFVQVSVEGIAVRSPDRGQPGALAGTALAWTIPAGALQPASRYEVLVTVERRWQETNASPPYLVTARRIVETRLPLATRGGSPPRLAPPVWVPEEGLRLRVVASEGAVVTLESAPALPAAAWRTEWVTNPAAGVFEITLPADEALRVYRARTP